MQLIDTHCHLDVEEFDPDRERVIDEARAAGVGMMVVPAIHAAGFDGLLALCRRHDALRPALGLHPVYLQQHRPEHLVELAERVNTTQPIAIGEIGLDYFVRGLEPEAQQRLFESQLEIARGAGLPVLLHLRKSHDRALATLRRLRFAEGGIAHAFNGSRQQAEQFIAMGFKLGFGGVLTFERARKIRALAAGLPLEAIVLETDAPDLAPAWAHGERNSPAQLPRILEALAALRGESPEAVAGATTRNARAVLRV